MSEHGCIREQIIFADPILQRVFFDRRELLPTFGQESEFQLRSDDLAALKLQFLKCDAFADLNRLRVVMRIKYAELRALCEGWTHRHYNRLVGRTSIFGFTYDVHDLRADSYKLGRLRARTERQGAGGFSSARPT